MTSAPRSCIFCFAPGPFSTKEHIVPQSLGNDDDVLVGAVCDSCQNYFSRAIEGPALEKTLFAFWRTYLGIRTKRGKLPSVNLSKTDRGKIRAFHPLADDIGFTAHDDGSTSVEIEDSELMRSIVSGRRNWFNFVLSPWHLSIMGRFLGKMGLEFVALHRIELALEGAFHPMREYVRRGSTRSIWPIYWGQQGTLKDLKGPLIQKPDAYEQEIQCYRYALGESRWGDFIFVFSIGTDVMAVCLSHPNLDPRFSRIIDGVAMVPVFYSDWEIGACQSNHRK